jgi:hypothetical protein
MLSQTNLQNQCGITHKRREDFLVVETIHKHHKIGISYFHFTHPHNMPTKEEEKANQASILIM